MSGLRGRIKRLTRSNYVYFSPADLAIIRDQYLGYLTDEGGTPKQFSTVCEEIEQIISQRTPETIEAYSKKLNEISREDPKAYYAWMYQVHSNLHNDHLDGFWIWDTKFIEILMRRLDDARRYFRDKQKST